MLAAAIFFVSTVVAILAVTGGLHLAPRVSRGLSDWLCKAPGLDLVVYTLTVFPQIAGLIVGFGVGGWLGALGYLALAVVAQCSAMVVWMRVHELAHPEAMKGPRIKKVLNARVGPVRNTVAVWWTAWAVPVFALIRLAEWLVYPPLIWLTNFPRYNAADWIAVSRQKHEHLVGADRIWCLYCDWMTGVWSLGSEMLRNVESFWCPIRYASPEKCANCSIDFPDIEGGWTPHDGDMAGVAKTLEAHYPGPDGVNGWFAHPSRKAAEITVNGKQLEQVNPDAVTDRASPSSQTSAPSSR
ncbi:MAG: hypothetical protein AAF743_08230 [Planctomycetota bacterium]